MGDSGRHLCGIDGCRFEAKAEQLQVHILQLHTSGLYSRLAVSNSPEDIQKWRDERKRKYPTVQQTQEAEVKRRKTKEDRAKKFHERQKSYQESRWDPAKGVSAALPEKRNLSTKKKPFIDKFTFPDVDDDSNESLRCGVAMFTGSNPFRQMAADAHHSGSKDWLKLDHDGASRSKNEEMCSDNEDDAPLEQPVCRQSSLGSQHCDEEHVSLKRDLPVNQTEALPNFGSGKKVRASSSAPEPKKVCALQRLPKLMEKLFQEDLRRDRQFLLQCIHYLCENNFWLPPQTSGNGEQKL